MTVDDADPSPTCILSLRRLLLAFGADVVWALCWKSAADRPSHDLTSTSLLTGAFDVPPHFDLKRDATGWTVFDRWTGQAVVIALLPQSGLTFADAEELVRELNGRGDEDDRTVLQ